MAGPGGTEVGRVSVRVVPDTDNFRRDVEKELKEIENLSAEIEVTLNLEKFKAQVEEVKLALKSIQDEDVNVNVDKNGGVAKLGDDVKKAGEELGKAARKMKGLGDDTSDTDRRVGFFARSLESIGGFAQRAGSQLADMGSKGLSELGDQARSATSGLIAMIAQLTIWVPLLAVAAGGITYLVGLIAAAIAALPALLFGIGAPIAAVILGFDGLKKAFQGLAPEFDKMKKRLSDTFEKGFKPVAEGLKPLLPVLSDGLNGTAEALGRFGQKFTDMLNSSFKWGGLATNMENFKNALKGVPDFIDHLSGGFDNFVESIIRAAGQSGVFAQLGDAVSGMFDKFAGFFNQSIVDGSFMKGIENFKKTLIAISGLLTEILKGALNFFNGAAPGVNSFFESIGRFIKAIPFEKLGQAFGGALERVGKAIDKIPPQTIDSISQSFSDLADAVADIFDGKSFDVLIGGFQLLLDIITGIAHAVDGFLETLAHIGDFIAGIPDWFSNLDLSDIGGTIFGGFGTGAMTKMAEFFDWLGGVPDKIKNFFTGAGSWLLDRGQDIVNGIRDGATTAFTNVSSFFQSIPGRIKGFFNGAVGWLQETGRNIMNGLGQGASGAWLVVQMTFQSVKNRVIAFFYGAGSWLLDAGSKIIGGLVSGIRNAIPTITSILGTVTRLIPTWKGPAEKDKMLLYGNGLLIMGSLVKGLTAGFGDVQSTLGGMTTELGNAFTSPTLQGDITMSGQDIAAVGTSQLQIAGQVDNGLEAAVSAALSNWDVVIDANGIARLVNKANQQNKRRG